MRFSRPTIISFALHAGAIVSIVWLTGQIPPKPQPFQDTQIIDLSRYLPLVKQPSKAGGGGGGDRSPLPASFGALPKASPRPFTPPAAVVYNQNPILLVEPSIYSPEEIELPKFAATNWGDPKGLVGPPSNGPGKGGGIGPGCCGGVGDKEGPGYGPGRGPGVYGMTGVYSVGRDVTSPVLIYGPEPEYSEEARKAKFIGTVRLEIVVGENGQAIAIRVTGPVGLGLDEKAMEAVKRWRFKPGSHNGKPVKVSAQVEVNFRIL
jgi:TonB family protein